MVLRYRFRLPDDDSERKPCVGLCYYKKVLALQNRQQQQQDEQQQQQADALSGGGYNVEGNENIEVILIFKLVHRTNGIY